MSYLQFDDLGFFLSLRLETAKRFYEDMKSRRISSDVVTYNTMIDGYSRFKMMGIIDLRCWMINWNFECS